MNHHRTDQYRERGASYRGMEYRDYRPRRRSVVDSLADAARDNPLPAALIGMGALWLFMGGNRMSLLGGNGRRSVIGAVAHGTSSAAHGAVHAAGRAGEAMGQAGEAVSSAVSSTAGSIAETVSDTASRVGSYVRGSVRGVDAQSSYRKSGAGYDFDEVESDWQGNRNGSSPLAAARNNMQDMLDRHPVALGIAGLALGMGVAASLPLTSRERETFGAAGDAVRGKMAEATEQAKDIASAAMDEVKNEMGRQQRPM